MMAFPVDGQQSSVDAAGPAMDRSNSLASVASGQSASSLTRRPRARSRSRPRALTLTSPKRRDKSASSTPDMPMFTAAEMLDAHPLPLLDGTILASTPPDRPPRSPLRNSSTPIVASPMSDFSAFPGAVATDDAELETRRRSIRSEEDAERRRRKRGSSVPRDAYRLSFLSSASSPTSILFPHQHHMHMQTVPNFPSLRETRRRLRDSYLTALSGTSTSLYPLSTSTGSGTDSPPSPRSLADSYHDNAIRHVNPDDKDDPSFDPDDVSGRLRLLLNNSYYLPPAHSKPSPAQLVPAGPKKPQPKGFLELFRPRSKSRSEAPPALATPQNPLPTLRTTSDTSTAGRQWPTPSPPFAMTPNAPSRPQTARVAVVRETLDDLAAAVKQAEREIKALENQEDAVDHKPIYDVIDPTDTVDLPPPSADSPFAVQTSALAGLGVEQSVGAAVLAERLPPGTPGTWSVGPDDSWRKALLHEAVSLSLTSTPAPSRRMRHPSDISSSIKTPLTKPSSTSMSMSVDMLNSSRIDQHILMPDRLEDVVETGVELPTEAQRPKLRTRASAPETRIQVVSQLAVPLPAHPPRAESPQTPHTPLLPPPRKASSVKTPFSSLSDIESSRGPSPSPSIASRGVRKISSSPQMSRDFASSITPTRPLSPVAEPVTTHHITKTSMDTSGDEDGHELDGRHSTAASVAHSITSVSLTRSSHSELYQPSPTRSAFHDARVEGSPSPVPTTRDSSDTTNESAREDSEHSGPQEHISSIPPSRIASLRQMQALTPPPRTSSSLAHTPLRPPPRSSSFNPRVPSSRHVREPSPRPSISSSDPGHSAFVSAVDLRDPSPRRPGTSRSEQTRPAYQPRSSMSSTHSTQSRHRRGMADTSLQVPGAMLAHALKDVPPSPIDFFDQVEAASHLRRSWDDEDDGAASSSTDDYGTVWQTPAHFTPSPQPSPAASSLSLPAGLSSTDSLVSSRRRVVAQPVGNVAPRPAYFKDTRAQDVLDVTRTPRATPAAVSSSSARSVTTTTIQADDSASVYSGESGESSMSASRGVGRTPSMLRLDGLLMQHMEAERKAFHRIAQASKAGSVRSET